MGLSGRGLLFRDCVERHNKALERAVKHSRKAGDRGVEAAERLGDKDLFEWELRKILTPATSDDVAVDKASLDLKGLAGLRELAQNLRGGDIVAVVVGDRGGPSPGSFPGRLRRRPAKRGPGACS